VLISAAAEFTIHSESNQSTATLILLITTLISEVFAPLEGLLMIWRVAVSITVLLFHYNVPIVSIRLRMG
jgi:hypothetical protein